MTPCLRVPMTILALTMLLFSACGDGNNDCPPCDGTATASGYGNLVFGQEGPDSKARKILKACDWDVHGDHNGGRGETLQIGGCRMNGQFGVVLVWAFNSFTGYRVCDAGFNGDINPPLGEGQCRVVGSYFRN